MPWGLKRFHASGQTHFVTFCCYHRRLLFTAPVPRQVFEAALEASAPQLRTLRLRLRGHARTHSPVLCELQQHTLADAIKSLKQGVSRRLIGEAERFWQKRYHDFNGPERSSVCGKASIYSSESGKAVSAGARRIGSGAVFASTRRAAQGGWRLNANGRRAEARKSGRELGPAAKPHSSQRTA